MTPEMQIGLNRYLVLAGKYFDLKFSEAMFSGAILQVAYMAIRLYSGNSSIPPSCAELVQPTHTSPPSHSALGQHGTVFQLDSLSTLRETNTTTGMRSPTKFKKWF